MIRLYRKIIVFIVLFLPSLFVSPSEAQKGDEIAKTFINNVVQITAKFSNEEGEDGFGFVVGEKDNMLYVVTANHVIHWDEPDVKTTKIQVRFYYDPTARPADGELLRVADYELDVALFRVVKPSGYKLEKNVLCSDFKKNEKVWFVGLKRKWDIPPDAVAGTLWKDGPDGEGLIIFTCSAIERGTSGAPLFTENGIIGMIRIDETNKAEAVHIDRIQNLIYDACGRVCPWELIPFGAKQPEVPDKPEEGKTPPKQITNSIDMKFVYIEPGTFMMGSPPYRGGNDEKQHKVTLTKGFYMQTTEVTQGQWKTIMKDNPSKYKACGDDCPVERVSWDDTQDFIKKLNRKEGKKYRLPTEAEWEYTARAGTNTAYNWGRKANCSKANYGNSYASDECKETNPGKTMKVASFSPNIWGLYDMHGNVREWCQDWYGNYPASNMIDPTGPDTSSYRVTRGGSYFYDARYCRSASRNRDRLDHYGSDLGFRVVREVP